MVASKLTTKIETTEKFIVMGGNLLFIAIQCLNGYNALFKGGSSVDPAEINRLIELLQSLVNRFNVASVNQTAFQRASQAARAGGTSSAGAEATSNIADFDREFPQDE